ncbi:gliding motility protein RemB [Flavobacterium sp. SUN052]|uniref:gliding motility protein RemB n=1 Tax=Flavobacterium sp. SUN052 TaxID=3002441 RepID=UPI00237EC84E|nr:gliding motility protein RemB [Flavobacterium sp. SUN052]MEC4003199.1 gliding motility protein RemB [Flavobacterium sp. SUN052]
MLKNTTLFLFLISLTFASAQTNSEQMPIFPKCENLKGKQLENCFNTEVQNFVYNNFQVPEKLKQNNYNGTIIVLFEVNDKGAFTAKYVDANEEELIAESKRVFSSMPKVTPPTYNGKPTYAKFTIKIAIPLKSPEDIAKEKEAISAPESTLYSLKEKNKELTEFDSIAYQKFKNPQFESHLNIPFSHSYYAQFDAAMNRVGSNNHTASKPYTYAEVSKYYNLEEENQKLMKNKTSWWAKKLWNENTVAIQGDGYWFTMNPIFDLQMGKSDPSKSKSTFVNTRGIQVRGGLGNQFNFTTTIYESQGRFADYFNNYAMSIKPSGGNPAIIPGIGVAKEFKTDAYDFPMAEANLTFAPSKFFDIQLGYGRNFLGDGYRSLILTDGVSPYPYLKINTTFWKIKYTNTYMWMKDVRDAVTVDGTYATKYVANHYLSWNVTKRFNLGLFESVVWANQNNRGFDMSFVNPIIFYRAVEISASSKSGNALLGLTGKYKWNNQFNFYGQFLIDEFSFGEVKAGNKSWKNKFAYQIGAKYFNAFNVDNLLLQVEFNHIRPYVYSHSDALTNYGSSNQSLGHQWGGNAKELVAIARYHKGRYYGDAKMTFGVRGLDFNTTTDTYNYGGNIYLSYNDNRPYNNNVTIGQGNKTTIFITDLHAGYLVNPATNLKVFGSLIYRNFKPTVETDVVKKESTTWFSIGLRCDIFNWYLDY